MIDLCAIAGIATDAPAPIPTTHRNHIRKSRRDGMFMSIEADHNVDSLFFDDRELTLICRTDLLAPERSTSIAAQLVQLYRERGDQFVATLRGTFAIILYEHRQRNLKAWTDHFGAERLVFAEFGETLAISTDIGWVAKARREKPSVSTAAIQEYLQYTCIPAPRTIYEGVSKLAPGHQLTSLPTVLTRPYWDMVYQKPTLRPPATMEAAVRESIGSAVALSLKNLEPPQKAGCFLSGGTDSSSVAGLVGRSTGQPPRTFSIGFDDPRYNEIEYARIAAKHFSADHHEYFVKPDDIPVLVQKAAQAYDEPFGNSSIVPTYYCARLAAEHGVTHLLAGDGGDELFGGNARYAGDRVFQNYMAMPKFIRKWAIEPAVSHAARWTNLGLLRSGANYVRRSNIPVPDRYFSYSLIQSEPAEAVFATDLLEVLRQCDPISVARNHFRAARAETDLNRWLYLDLKITIADNDLRKVMTMSRLAGVTPRFPFLIPELAELTGAIPAELKVKGRQLRYLFKRAMTELLPHEIIKKSKHGFGLPFAVWLADSKILREFTFDALGSARCRQRGYFRAGLFESLWNQYLTVHRGYYGEILWTLLMLELWHVAHVDRPLEVGLEASALS